MKKLFKILSVLAIGISIYSFAFAGGIDQYSKLLEHGDGADTATFIPDSSNYDHYGITDYLDKCVAMLHFDGADTSTTTTEAQTNKAVTFVGNAQIDTAQSKFGGSSLYCDGNGDYVTLLDSPDWTFGTGDFAIILWARWATLPAYGQQQAFLTQYEDNDNRTLFYLFHAVEGESGYRFYFGIKDTGVWTIDLGGSNQSLVINTWYHIALVRYGNIWKIYLDGTCIDSLTDSDPVPDLTGLFIVGQDGAGSSYFNGWIDDYYVVKGKALYTANFTVPTISPSPKDVTCVGTAQIDTAQKKFGTGSILLDGDSDYVSLLDSDDWNFGSEAWTIDFWVRFNALSANALFCGQFVDDNNLWYTFIAWDTGRIYLYSEFSGTIKQIGLSSDYTWNLNTWYHVCFAYDGATNYIFINGISMSISGTYQSFVDLNSVLSIGSGLDEIGVRRYVNGWIDEPRISKGIARQTSNFPPETEAYNAELDYKGQAIVIIQ